MSKNLSPWLALITLIFGTVLVGLDKTVVNLAIPTIITFFGISLSTAGWIMTIYILTTAIFVPIFGKIGCGYGHRRIFAIGFVSFVFFSVLGGLSWNIYSLLIFRALQGVAGAAVYPTAMSIIAKIFKDKGERAQALGLWSAMMAVSIAIGPLVGGPLIDNFSWRSVFFINLPVGLIGIFMIFLFVPKDEPEEKGKFDFFGSILLGFALASLLIVLDKGIEWGWTSFYSLMLYLGVIIFFFFFYLNEKKFSNPIIDLKHFRNPTLVAALGVALISLGVFTSTLLVVSIFAQETLKYNATKAGYLFLPSVLGYVFCAPLGAKFSKKINPKYIISGGIFLGTIGSVMLSFVNPNEILFTLIIPLIFMGAGLGMGTAPLTVAVTTSVPHHEIGVASGLLNLTRNVSGAFGIAFLVTLMHNGISYKIVFLISAGFIFLGAIIALFIKESKQDFTGIDKTKEPHKPVEMK